MLSSTLENTTVDREVLLYMGYGIMQVAFEVLFGIGEVIPIYDPKHDQFLGSKLFKRGITSICCCELRIEK